MLPLSQRYWRENNPWQGLWGKQESVFKGEKKHAGTLKVQRLAGAAFVPIFRALVLIWLLGHLALWSRQSKGNVWGREGGDIKEHTSLQIQHNYNKAI